MQPSNNILAFLQEMVQRLFLKSPKFFRVWQLISGALVLITGIPQLLAAFSVKLPEEINNNLTTAIGWASRGIFIMSLMTTQSKPAAIDSETGEVLKKTNSERLPFTANSEIKEAEKKSSIPIAVELQNS